MKVFPAVVATNFRKSHAAPSESKDAQHNTSNPSTASTFEQSSPPPLPALQAHQQETQKYGRGVKHDDTGGGNDNRCYMVTDAFGTFGTRLGFREVWRSSLRFGDLEVGLDTYCAQNVELS